MTNEKWPFRYDLLLRLRLIEVVALWEGQVNTSHLIKYFGIGRQQASADLKKYRNEISSTNLVYDASAKAYLPSAEFTPVLTAGSADEYLHLLDRNSDLNLRFEKLELGFGHCHQLPVPSRTIRPEVLRPIVKACQKQLRLEVDYRSISDPQPDGRVIAPHSIVYATNRWHVRAFCEKNQDFRDFVLTRFFSVPEIEDGTAGKTESDDVQWNTQVNVSVVPDPRLTEAQKSVIQHDYGMTEGKLLITVRASLLAYLLKELRIDAHIIHADPRAQQVIVENLDDIKQWVFG